MKKICKNGLLSGIFLVSGFFGSFVIADTKAELEQVEASLEPLQKDLFSVPNTASCKPFRESLTGDVKGLLTRRLLAASRLFKNKQGNLNLNGFQKKFNTGKKYCIPAEVSSEVLIELFNSYLKTSCNQSWKNPSQAFRDFYSDCVKEANSPNKDEVLLFLQQPFRVERPSEAQINSRKSSVPCTVERGLTDLMVSLGRSQSDSNLAAYLPEQPSIGKPRNFAEFQSHTRSDEAMRASLGLSEKKVPQSQKEKLIEKAALSERDSEGMFHTQNLDVRRIEALPLTQRELLLERMQKEVGILFDHLVSDANKDPRKTEEVKRQLVYLAHQMQMQQVHPGLQEVLEGASSGHGSGNVLNGISSKGLEYISKYIVPSKIVDHVEGGVYKGAEKVRVEELEQKIVRLMNMQPEINENY
ncbi:MAG: hypothetical protein HYX41_03825, partial [Bdellovibrio sp.]|nr:hypothetical protein [Bdellovibrio sp.]